MINEKQNQIEELKTIINEIMYQEFNNVSDGVIEKLEECDDITNDVPMEQLRIINDKFKNLLGDIIVVKLETIDNEGEWRQYDLSTDIGYGIYLVTELSEDNIHEITCINIFDDNNKLIVSSEIE